MGWKDSFVEKSVPIIPISGWLGDNLIKKSENMGWWTGVDVETPKGKVRHAVAGQACAPMCTHAGL